MGAIEGFHTTWNRARMTYGDGAPQTGERFDNSSRLTQLAIELEAAAPGSRWTGAASEAYNKANTEHRTVFTELAKLDRRLAIEVNNSAQVVDTGRRNLEAVRQWVQAADASVPASGSSEHARMAIARKGLAQLEALVRTSNAEAAEISERIKRLAGQFRALGNQKYGSEAHVDAEDNSRGEIYTVRGIDFKTDLEAEPPPLVPGQPVDPTDPFIGDQRFGHWERVIAPPYTGPTPPPLTTEYRPFQDDPVKVGGTTGWYTPGKNWAADKPYAQYQEAYRFRIAGAEATTTTRMVYENGTWHQERWVQNLYEYQRNTQMVFGGDVSVRGKVGDIAGLPTIPKIDYEWKPIALNEIASLSAKNVGITYYLPDGCGGQITYEKGSPVGGTSGLPLGPPIMTNPR